jgi:hypothetical protein
MELSSNLVNGLANLIACFKKSEDFVGNIKRSVCPTYLNINKKRQNYSIISRGKLHEAITTENEGYSIKSTEKRTSI